MDQRVVDFLLRSRVSSLTTLLSDGTPHAATMHFVLLPDSKELIFLTHRSARKFQGLADGLRKKASVVIGFSEEEWLTLQMEGEIESVEDESRRSGFKELWLKKYSDWRGGEDAAFLSFKPQWWRYSDYKKVPPVVISSE